MADIPKEYQLCKVIDQISPTDVLRVLKVEAPEGLIYKPGQFTKIGFMVAGVERPLTRAYSFVNNPNDNVLEFCYDVLREGGNLTLLLDKLQAGDEILVSMRPNGLLTVDELPKANHLLMIGTGTGIGPFIAITEEADCWKNFERMAIVYSVRNAEDLVYRQRIQAIKEKHQDRFSFIPLVTRQDEPDTLKMRVTDALIKGELTNLASMPIDLNTQFMMCGNPEMVREMSELLKARGLERNRRRKPGNVTIEKYW